MKADTLEAKVHEFLAQKRIAVAGVSRNNGSHPVGNLIYHRLRKTGHDVFPVNPHMRSPRISCTIAATPGCAASGCIDP
jgi:predicted CoA-binding protein